MYFSVLSATYMEPRRTEMQEASYYRDQASRARRLARGVTDREVADQLARTAEDYDDIAEDLERGIIEVRHRELMPQLRRDR